MSELPELDRAADATKDAARKAKGLVPWLPDPLECEACEVYCDPSICYDPQLHTYVKSWECPECEQAFRRMEPWDE